MILVAVDDLLFTSKIHAAATQRGVDVVFARSPENVLQRKNVCVREDVTGAAPGGTRRRACNG